MRPLSTRTYWTSAAVMMALAASTGAGITLVANDLLGVWAVLVLPVNVTVGIAIGSAWSGWLYSRRTGTWPPLRFYRGTFLASLRFVLLPPGRFLPNDDRRISGDREDRDG